MSVLAINDRFVRSEIVTAASWNQFFADIATGLNASVTGLEAANITNLSIGGSKIADGAVTTAKINNNAVDGATEIDDQQILARHLSFDGVATTVHELNTNIGWGADGIHCIYQINQPNKGTQMMIFGMGSFIHGTVTAPSSETGTINFNTSYFGDPNFGGPGTIVSSPTISIVSAGSLRIAGFGITSITGLTSMNYQFETTSGGPNTVSIYWSILARRSL